MATKTLHQEISSNKTKTWALLMLFVVFIGVVAAALNYMYDGSFFVSSIVIPIALIYGIISYYGASKMAVAVNGAKEIQESDNPRLYHIVENLAITEGLPMPKVYIMDDPGMNAFATGRNPEHAIVAATTGLLDSLSDIELEGVMAHELGHVKNYDIRVSLMAFALVAVISILADFAMNFLWFGSSDRRESGGPTIIIGLAIALLAPLIASMIKLAVSRQREFLADATGAMTTRYPEGLASALEKISQGGSVTKHQNSSTAHFFFANPLKKSAISGLFSTHPPADQRIARLRDMEDGVLGNGK